MSQTLPFNKNNTGLRDVSSFSTFLGGVEESYVRRFSASSRDLNPNITNTNQDEHHYSGRKKEEDGEIGVFGAEKYFNGGIHVESPRVTKTVTKSDAKTLECVEGNIEPIKPVIIHQGTPSVRSESTQSSWNSQIALLHGKKVPSKVNGRSFLSGLAGCKCYCSGRKSVDTEEVQVGEISFKRPTGNGDGLRGKQNKTAAIKASLEVNNKQVAEPWMKEDIFTFPAMNSAMGLRPVKVPLQTDADEIGRKSLEVFGSPVLGKRNKSLNIERRLKMLSWDYSTKIEGSETHKGNYNDTDSDASSDLFEIESLSGKANPFLAKQASDLASGCVTPTTCYAPSEVSIDWSVVTASAVDFYEDLRPSITIPSPTENNKEYRRRRSSGLLGCKSQKAVEVAGDTHKANEKAGFDPRIRRASDSYVPAARFQPTQTPRASHLLYIQ